MREFSGLITFRIDPLIGMESRRLLEDQLSDFKNAEIQELKSWAPENSSNLLVDFLAEGSLHLAKAGPHIKLCLLDENQGLFSFGQSIEDSLIDGVLDSQVDIKQISMLIQAPLMGLVQKKEQALYQKGIKNLRRFETALKSKKEVHNLTSEALLSYTQALVDLEKELIHAEDIPRISKVVKQFAKNQFEKSKFNFYTSDDIYQIGSSSTFLVLPKYKGHFLAIEMNWEEEDYLKLLKRFFFFYTLVSFILSQQEIRDPFFDEKLWENVLDSIPFPVALLSQSGEVYQHNTLFSKLNFTPQDCLKLKLRDKILINDIPYNIFRKDTFHLDENKILFVFFTESFFLKGDGNLTPSGQELGIISSSIAHELNNPIAGIQTALSLLMLDDDLNEEAKQTLSEMKNGAIRCKQLIETFLGFSRANPKAAFTKTQVSPVEVCYGQAQNLLRFRTVESGIRFSIEYSNHTDFRASVNLSLLTMTFYLIMGELMTLYSHQLLIANKSQIEKVIKGELIESSQEIQIQLHELNISGLTLSKLIQNLLNIENFVLQVSDYSLRFIYNPPRDD
ncbi:MAG: histidine kinase dimerization/phospho-acceptor domain-containing protein [Bacteriovoracaceae bacterium]